MVISWGSESSSGDRRVEELEGNNLSTAVESIVASVADNGAENVNKNHKIDWGNICMWSVGNEGNNLSTAAESIV